MPLQTSSLRFSGRLTRACNGICEVGNVSDRYISTRRFRMPHQSAQEDLTALLFSSSSTIPLKEFRFLVALRNGGVYFRDYRIRVTHRFQTFG